jgi:DNA-binding SARP family transcriptional activator
VPGVTEFRVLGPVEIVADERRIDAGEPKQRCVLCALAADANQGIPADSLIDRVWGDNPPRTARSSLYTYIAKLRSAMPTGAAAIVRRAGGYMLTADAELIDLHHFRRLVTRARAAADNEQADLLYAQALGLWHGDAFATLDTPWLNTLRHTLNTERLIAELEHADLLLRIGHHGRLLAELSARADAHPFDERICAQLMLALYRCGRVTDALARYQHARRRLAEEVGSDPSPPLQRLHHQILTADPALAAAPALTVRATAGAAKRAWFHGYRH